MQYILPSKELLPRTSTNPVFNPSVVTPPLKSYNMAEWGATDTPAWGDATDDATMVTDSVTEVGVDTFPLDDGLKEIQEKKVWRIRKNEIEE